MTVPLRIDDEEFVFNSAGQVIDVAGLIVVARDCGRALANAVKDSMESKTTPETRNVLAVVYGTRRVLDAAAMATCSALLADRFHRFCGAESVAADVLV